MEQPEPLIPDTGRKCLNCGAQLSGPFCSRCGQKDLPEKLTLKELILSFIDSFTSFDSKFFKTFKYLLLYPGFLAMEYNAGRRERYYPPARGYVFLSFIFFFLYFTLPDRNDSAIWFKFNVSDKGSAPVHNDRQGGVEFQIDSLGYSDYHQYDSLQKTLPSGERDGLFERILIKRILKNQQEKRLTGNNSAENLSGAFVGNLPKVLFFLLPIFALLLKMLYIHQDIYYTEHLVFSITCYNFYYLLFSILMLIELIPGSGWLTIVGIAGFFTYFLLALKRMYRQSWPLTVMKFILFGLLFNLSAAVGFALNLIITFMIT